MSDQVSIYGLRSKEQSQYGYVGQTSNPAIRLQQHLYDVTNDDLSNTAKRVWVENVIQSGSEIVMDILEECNRSDAANRELHWIKTFINAGHELTNCSMVAQARFELYIQSLYANEEPVITDADLDGEELAEHLCRIETSLFQNGNILRAVFHHLPAPVEGPG
jgi:hypothetical protein